jgi:transcriptional regulator with XRE-family HTH domain
MTPGAGAEPVARAMAMARWLSGMGTREFASAICESLGRRSLHPSTVSKWEHGVVTPPADVLVAAALVANVPIQVLFDDDPAGSGPADRLRRLEEQVRALSGRLALLDGNAGGRRPWPDGSRAPAR